MFEVSMLLYCHGLTADGCRYPATPDMTARLSATTLEFALRYVLLEWTSELLLTYC
jgi:hypothetical protein